MFLPDPQQRPLEPSCTVVLEWTTTVRADPFDTPLALPDHSWFTDSSSYSLHRQQGAGDAVVTSTHTVGSSPVAPNTSAQKAELSTFTGALQLGTGLKINMDTASEPAYHSLHSCAAAWRDRGLLPTRGPSIKQASLTLELSNRQLLPIVGASLRATRWGRRKQQSRGGG